MNLEELKIEDIKQIQLDILSYVDKICTENNITYFLAYGTLLGAIRHKGYIPWDDDIDIMMTHDNYLRLKSAMNNECSQYVLKTYDENDYYNLCSKIMDKNTVLQENTRYKSNLGINIDVFVLENINDENDIILSKMSRLKSIHDLKNIKIRRGRKLYKNLILIISQLVFGWVNMHSLTKKIMELSFSYYEVESGYVFTAMDCKLKKLYNKEIFNKAIYVEFEGLKFPAPHRYDEFLTITYGDYMKLPPKEKRVAHHDYKAYKKF